MIDYNLYLMSDGEFYYYELGSSSGFLCKNPNDVYSDFLGDDLMEILKIKDKPAIRVCKLTERVSGKVMKDEDVKTIKEKLSLQFKNIEFILEQSEQD